jgi:hypothetical protein
VTYDATLPADLDKVRFYLQDTVSGSGPKPADGNFTDGEITGLITVEGSWQRAVAAGFETLAAAWRRYPSFTADGLQLDRNKIADGYAAQATVWRKAHGDSVTARGGSGGAGSRSVTKIDGYSSTVTNTET